MQCLILHRKSQKESLYIPIKFPASYISMLKNSWNSLAPNVASPPMIKISTVPPRIMKTKAGFFACNYTIIKFTFFFWHINQISSKKRGKETLFFVPKARGIWGDVLCFCQNFLLPCIFSVNYSELLKSSPSASYHNLYFLNRNKLVKLSFNNLMVSI